MLEFDLWALPSITRGPGVNDRGRKRRKQIKKEEKLISHKVPVYVSEEGVTHYVGKACLRVAAETLLGILQE